MDNMISRAAVLDEIHKYMEERDYTIGTLYDNICEMPSAQPSATDTNVATTDSISRQAAIDSLGKDPMGGLNYESILGSLPSAQPDIVACGDCIHWICHDRRCGYWNHGVKPLDWCCHAERRTNG